MSEFIAFRRLVCRLSQQLSNEERETIVYVRLHSQQHKYKSATNLEVLSKLETDGLFSVTKPEGLIEIAKDVNRQDLVGEVKEFLTNSKKKSSSKTVKKERSKTITDEPKLSEEELLLQATFEVTLAQSMVLMRQVYILQSAIAGGKEQREKAAEVIREVGLTADTLSQRLREAQRQLGLCRESGDSSSEEGVSPMHEDTPVPTTETLQGATVLPVQSQDQPQRRKPVPRPRNQRRPEVTAKIPTQETGGSAQTLSSYFARTCLTNERLNPMAAPLSPETRTFRPRGWPADVDIRSKSVPNTLAEQRRSSKPVIPPRHSSLITSQLQPPPAPAKQPTADDTYYEVLRPEKYYASGDGDYTGSGSDSGFSDARQWKRYIDNPPPETSSTQHYYKSLHKNEVEEASYEPLTRPA